MVRLLGTCSEGLQTASHIADLDGSPPLLPRQALASEVQCGKRDTAPAKMFRQRKITVEPELRRRF